MDTTPGFAWRYALTVAVQRLITERLNAAEPSEFAFRVAEAEPADRTAIDRTDPSTVALNARKVP